MLTAEQLYKEMQGTLTPAEDPSSQGSQASTYGYLVGQGVAFTEKLNLFNKRQDNGTGRPITVNIRIPERVGPGVVSEAIIKQQLTQAIDVDEWRTHVRAYDPTTPATQEIADIRLFAVVLVGNNESQVAITDELQTQLLLVFDNASWPQTRTNLIAALERSGSRSEEMQGFSATIDDLRAADAWGVGNGRPTLYE